VSLSHEILAVVTRGLLRAVEGRGLERAALLRAAGLSELSLERADRWLPVAQHLRVGQAIAAAFPDTNVGLQTGAPIYSDPRGALGYCLRRSRVHRRALRNFAAYIGTVNRAVRLVLLPEPRGAALALEMVPQMAAAGHPAESLLAAWLSLSRYLTGSVWHPLQVEFAHQPFGNSDEHAALFGCPVAFGQAQTRLILSEAALDLAVAELPHEFDDTIERAGHYARGFVGSDAGARASLAALLQRLSAPLDIDALRESLTPGQLDARLALARALCERSGAFVHEIAYLLGFESHDALERAFFEHFGAYPAQMGSQS
jgi:AraC-type transcriptional regulator